MTKTNVFDYITLNGHDLDFVPSPCTDVCDWPKQSFEQLEVLRQRIERGEELLNPLDSMSCASQEEKSEAIRKMKEAGRRIEKKPTRAELEQRRLEQLKVEPRCEICNKVFKPRYKNRTCSSACFIERARRKDAERKRVQVLKKRLTQQK